MHALIEKKYVVHLHTISVLSFAVLKEGKRLLKNKLKDVNWKWIKYKKPGIDLALEIKKKMLNKICSFLEVEFSNRMMDPNTNSLLLGESWNNNTSFRKEIIG